MPLSRGAQSGGNPDPGDGGAGEGGGGGFVPVIEPIGFYEPWWLAPDGTDLQLNPPGSDLFSLKSVSGLGAVPLDQVTAPAADGGVTVESERVRERTIVWPLRIRGDTHLQFLERWRYVTDLFTQTKRLGPGRLLLIRPDGTSREIIARYRSGLEQEPEDGAWRQATPSITLLCPDGYWQGVEPVSKTWSQETGADFITPTYPAISSGQVLGEATLSNSGVADAWPTWTIRGPLSSLTATNVTRGETFVLTYTLTAGQVLTMSTRPIQVRGPGGVQAISALNLLAGGIPWRVDARSQTQIQFSASGAAAPTVPGGTDGTAITAQFHEKFETA
ncbi:phage tail domain-containing protein [Actinoplanes sp. NBRC 101535]|uniref:phage tail domain-containing protein n=1 Tax=Actinoplanes sp. NBRC 101535 TaxID=3032196 RepID=UPI00249FB8A9|nr:phage tail domain-containing protein [Actinoplanes sp. NBRC 101535]GLY08275.1 hypothetical protein Acsp01_86540 [Actinoplanes sp. NBRC 101535]